MKFQAWIQVAKELMDMMKQIPSDYPEMIQEYNSHLFSIRYNPITRSTTFKRTSGAEKVTSPGTHIHHITPSPSTTSNVNGNNITTGTGTLTIAGPVTVNAPLHNPNNIVRNDDHRLHVSITVRDGELIDLKFINKNLNSFQFSGVANEDGGTIEHTMLYIGSDKMIYNGVLYDLNSPDAFTHDISTDTDVSIMDLFYMKEYYEHNCKNI